MLARRQASVSPRLAGTIDLMTVTADYLAADLGLDTADLAVALDWLGHTDTELTPAACADVRVVLDDFCGRTVPEYWHGAALDWREVEGEL